MVTVKRIRGSLVDMKQRCYNPENGSFHNYGGRGIQICDEWKDADNFISWAISNGYKDSLSIDRINNDGNYCPSNCRWATALEQARNQRRTIKLLWDGKQVPLRELCEIHSINRRTVLSRLEKGWSVISALTSKINTPSEVRAFRTAAARSRQCSLT